MSTDLQHQDNGAPAGDGDESPPAPSAAVWSWQFWVVVGLLVAFGALALVMLLSADSSDAIWQRRIYVYGSVEAVVFAAVGWLFGREVSRAEVNTVKASEVQARKEAHVARSEARSQAQEASQAKQEAVEERVKGTALASAVQEFTTSDGTAPEGGAEDVAAGESRQVVAAESLASLRGIANRLYGPRPQGGG